MRLTRNAAVQGPIMVRTHRRAYDSRVRPLIFRDRKTFGMKQINKSIRRRENVEISFGLRDRCSSFSMYPRERVLSSAVPNDFHNTCCCCLRTIILLSTEKCKVRLLFFFFFTHSASTLYHSIVSIALTIIFSRPYSWTVFVHERRSNSNRYKLQGHNPWHCFDGSDERTKIRVCIDTCYNHSRTAHSIIHTGCSAVIYSIK